MPLPFPLLTRDHVRVLHARGSQDAQAPAELPLHRATGRDQGHVLEPRVRILVADEDPDPVSRNASVQDADEAALLLEGLEERAHATQVFEFRLGDDIRGPVQVDAGLIALDRECLLAERDHVLEEGVVEGLFLPHELEEPRADDGQVHPREMGVEVVGAGLEVFGPQLLLHLHDLVGHDARGRHHHDQDPGGGEGDQVDVAEAGLGDVGGEDEAHVPAQARQQVRRALQYLVERALRAQRALDGGRVPGGEGLTTHQAVHEEAVTVVGGHPPRARVGVVEVTEGLQVGHDAAEGGGGEGAVEEARETLRAHRLPGLDMQLDEGAQDVLAAVVEARRGHRFSRCLTWKSGPPG